MSKFKFTPEDFDFNDSCEVCARVANAKLEQWLKDAVVVYNNRVINFVSDEWKDFEYEGATHKAKLVCIEELSSDPKERE